MRPILALCVVAFVFDAAEASDPNRTASMQQQPKTGVDAVRLALSKIRLGMSQVETERILGNPSLCLDRRLPGENVVAGLDQYERPIQGGFELTIAYEYDQSTVRLTFASLKKCGDKVIYEVGKPAFKIWLK